MKNFKKNYAFIITLLFAQNIFAQDPLIFPSIHVDIEAGLSLDIYANKYVINYCSPNYELLKDTLNSTGRNLDMIEDCPICEERMQNQNHTFSHLEFLTGDYDVMDSLGYPALPFRGLNLQLPDDASNINVSISDLSTQRVEFPCPYIPSLLFKLRATSYSILLQPYYQTNGAGFYDTWYTLSDTYGFMGTTGVAFDIFPLRYNPQEKYADMIKCATFTISFKSGTSLRSLINSYVNGEHYGDAMSFYDTYTGMEWTEKTADKGNYVILTYYPYKDALDEFVAYKTSIGYNVQVYRVPTDVAADWAKIREFVKSLYKNTATRPRFLLLVGNPREIPYSAGYAQNTDDPPTDIYYACIEKGVTERSKEDMNPELYVGRWSVYNNNEVKYITQKTIETELALYGVARENRHVSLFAGTGNHSDWFRRDCEVIRDSYLNPTGIHNTYFNGQNGFTHSTMVSELEGLNGYNPFIFFYSGHGWMTGISTPYSLVYGNMKDIDGDLQNKNLQYQPFGFGSSCRLNSYDYQYNFGEGWTTFSYNGGITFFGATTDSYTEPNRYSFRSIFRYLKDKKNYNIAQMTAWGMGSYYSTFPSKYRRRQAAKYNLLGDPSALIYGVSRDGIPRQFLPAQSNYSSINDGNITIYPTLADNLVNIEAGSDIKILSINLYDLAGKILKSFDIASNTLDVSNIQNGTYILSVKCNDKQNYSSKIIINH
jgi:hypothetical protein